MECGLGMPMPVPYNPCLDWRWNKPDPANAIPSTLRHRARCPRSYRGETNAICLVNRFSNRDAFVRTGSTNAPTLNAGGRLCQQQLGIVRAIVSQRGKPGKLHAGDMLRAMPGVR